MIFLLTNQKSIFYFILLQNRYDIFTQKDLVLFNKNRSDFFFNELNQFFFFLLIKNIWIFNKEEDTFINRLM